MILKVTAWLFAALSTMAKGPAGFGLPMLCALVYVFMQDIPIRMDRRRDYLDIYWEICRPSLSTTHHHDLGNLKSPITNGPRLPRAAAWGSG